MGDARIRYRTGVTLATVAAGVLAVVLVAKLLGGSSGPSGRPAAALPRPHAPIPPGHVAPAQLSSYRWSALPAAPIATRHDGVVSVWTGSRMIVWGGESKLPVRLFDDGADFDPA